MGALVVGGLLFAVAVTMQEVGADPAATIRGAGYLALVLIAIGLVGLLSMLYAVYGEDEQ